MAKSAYEAVKDHWHEVTRNMTYEDVQKILNDPTLETDSPKAQAIRGAYSELLKYQD